MVVGISPKGDPVRMLAWQLLQHIENSQTFADILFDRTFTRNPFLKPLDRAFIMELVLGTLRWRGRLDRVIHWACKAPNKKIDSKLLQLLRLGAYQILFMDRVPDSAAVNESVHLAKAVFRSDRVAGFANAVLRNIARNKDPENFSSLENQPAEYISQMLSHPLWMVESWIQSFGPKMAGKICTANNNPPPFTVRTNTLKTSGENLQQALAALGIQSFPTTFSTEGLVLEKSFLEDDLFSKGMYFVQDEASQIIAHIIDPQPGERVLDACAAPGGKTTHMAQLMLDRGEVFAIDLYKAKLSLLRVNCRRLGISIVRDLQGNAAKPFPFPKDLAFDRILVDAPCSALGILHRHPEAKWRRKPDDIIRLQSLQRAILESASSHLKIGGVLVYSTCTMTSEENDSVVGGFLGTHKEFQLEDLRLLLPNHYRPLIDSGGFFRTYPAMIVSGDGYRMDGFFAARMRRI